MRELKIVAVGDRHSNKTQMLSAYITGTFTEPEQREQEESKLCDIFTETRAASGGESFEIKYFDTPCMPTTADAESSSQDRTRPLAYHDSHVFLLCLSVVCPPALDVVKHVWLPELKQYCPRTPILLVGTDTDSRPENDAADEDSAFRSSPVPITLEQGRQLAQELGAVKYVECSARTQGGLKDVMEEAIQLGIEELNRRRRKPRENLPNCQI